MRRYLTVGLLAASLAIVATHPCRAQLLIPPSTQRVAQGRVWLEQEAVATRREAERVKAQADSAARDTESAISAAQVGRADVYHARQKYEEALSARVEARKFSDSPAVWAKAEEDVEHYRYELEKAEAEALRLEAVALAARAEAKRLYDEAIRLEREAERLWREARS